MTLVLRYAARSDRGLVRANNEDSVYAGARLLALADGMGGHAAGEVASQLVIAALAHLDDDEPGGDLLSKLNSAVAAGNAAIAAHVEMEPELDGMGTTLTAILFAGSRLGLVHIGDSRGYLMRDGELAQITKDDTFVQTLVDEGRITAEEAHSHPQRSLIMRALTGHDVEPTLIMREAKEGDRYLLCSDGLSDPVSQETIHEALKIRDVAECADRLIELALRGGGPDNVTVVVADVVDYDYGGQTQPILAGAVSGDDDNSAPPNTAAGRAAAFNQKRNAAAAAKRAVTQPEPPPKPKSRRRIIIAAVLVVLALLAGLAVGRTMIRSNYYLSAYNGTVAIMRGVEGSILGVRLQEPYLLGCLNEHNELSQISYGQSADHLGCKLMQLEDLRPSERAQVSAGLPTGSLDNAIDQLRELVRSSLLPPCAPPAPPAAPTTTSGPPTPSGAPAPSGSATSAATPSPAAPTSAATPSPAAPTPSTTPTGTPSSGPTTSGKPSTTATSTTPPSTTTSPSATPSTTGPSTTAQSTAPSTTPSAAATSTTDGNAPDSPTSSAPAGPSSAVTQLPPAPQQPGIDCRAAV